MKLQKLFLILLLSIMLIPSYTIASSPSYWIKWTWNTTEDELGQNVYGIGNHLYLSGLYTNASGEDLSTKYLLMKWTKNGFLLWKTIGSAETNSTLSIWADQDFVYFTAITQYLYSNVYQYPTNGELSFAAVSGPRFYYDLMGYNNYYYIVGSRNESANVDLTLVKCYDVYQGVSSHPDSMGLWAQEFGEQGIEIGYDVWVDESGIYSLGFSTSYSENKDLLLIQWDWAGNLHWNRTWSIPFKNVIGKSVIAKDDMIITLGMIQSNSTGDSDVLLVCWDEEGNELWNNTWGGSGSEIAESVWILQNSIYCIGHTDRKVFVVEFNQTGDFVENHSVPELYHNSEYSKIWGDESSIFITGYTFTSNGDTALELLKFDPEGTEGKVILGYSFVCVISIVSISLLIFILQMKGLIKKRNKEGGVD